MLRLAIITLGLSVLPACERSSRNIEVQPINPNVRPDGNGSGDSKTRTGELSLSVKGLPSTASSADIKVSIDGVVNSRTVMLSGGSGTTRIVGVATGDQSIIVAATIDQKYYKGRTSAFIESSSPVTASVTLSPSDNNSVPDNGGDPKPNNNNNNNNQDQNNDNSGNQTDSGKDSNLEIEIGIGGNPSGGGGNNGGGNTVKWDGKSFKGNSIFSVEPVK